MKTLIKTAIFTTLFTTGSTIAATVWEPANATLDNALYNVDVVDVEGGQLALFKADDTAMANPLNLDEYWSINYAMPEGAATPTLMIMDAHNQFTRIATADNKQFMLGMYNGHSWVTDSTYQLFGGDFYKISFGGAGSATLVDLMPATDASGLLPGGTPSAVPLPGAVWLMGSALVGLSGLVRNRKHRQTLHAAH